VFDEKYQLMGILTLRDIIKGLETRFLHETSLIKSDPSLMLLTEGFRGAGFQEAAQKQVSEVMSPIKVTVDGEASLTKALFLMIKQNVGMMPVILDNKVAGMIRLSDLYKEISKIILGN
jgi:CBS domain-containing protein